MNNAAENPRIVVDEHGLTFFVEHTMTYTLENSLFLLGIAAIVAAGALMIY